MEDRDIQFLESVFSKLLHPAHPSGKVLAGRTIFEYGSIGFQYRYASNDWSICTWNGYDLENRYSSAFKYDPNTFTSDLKLEYNLCIAHIKSWIDDERKELDRMYNELDEV